MMSTAGPDGGLAPGRGMVARLTGSRALRWLGAACILAIGVLSLIPRYGPGVDNGAAQGPIPHFVAYFVTAAALGIGSMRRRNPLLPALALTAYAGAMEILQNFSPGRDPGLDGFLWSSVGAAVGALLAFLVRADRGVASRKVHSPGRDG